MRLVSFALVFALLSGGYLAYRSFAATIYYLSPNGNDSNACTQAAPCKTLTRGYQMAQSGDTVELAGGSYSGGTLSGTKQVTFKVAAGVTASFTSRVVLLDLQNATIRGPFSTKPAYNHTQDVKDFSVDGCSKNLNLYDIRASLFDVTGSADNISFYGGDFGDYSDTDQEDSWVGGDGTTCGDGVVSNLLFDGIYLHDVLYVSSSQWGDAHPDCLQTGGYLDGMTIRNSRIMRCGNSFFGFYGDFGNFTNLLIENNLFYGIKDSYWGFNIDPKNLSCSIIVRYNTYDPDNPNNAGYAYSPPSIQCQTKQVYGNIFRRGEPGGCNNNGWSYNVFEVSDPCGSNYVVGQAGFVSRGNDYHLTAGALALNKGDPSRFPTTDFDGQARATPPDAGADEYGGTVGPPPPPPPPAPTVSLTANPTSISSGSSSTLSWSSTNATSCTASGAWSGTKATSGTQSVSPTSTSTYNLSCTGSGGSANASATVTINIAGSFTIGETNILSTSDNGNGSYLLAQSANLSQTATIQSLSFYVTTAAGKLRLGIYDSSGPSGGPGVKKAETAEITPTTGWNTASVTSQVSLAPGTYWLAYLPSDNNLGFKAAQDSSSSGRYYSYAYGVLPNTFSSSPASNDYHWSFYATLNSSGVQTKPGDLNSDGTVNISDLSILLSSFNTANATADINKDGTVNILDLSILLSNYGA